MRDGAFRTSRDSIGKCGLPRSATIADNPWFESLMRRLLEGSPPVLALLEVDPFPDRPPKYVRAQLYDYRFADSSTRAATGQWWVRQLAGLYFPQVSLAHSKD